MNNAEKEGHISWLENLLQEFREATKRGKETNSNEERARSIANIEEITRRLEEYIQNNDKLLEEITSSKIELARNVDWDDVVRPAHFEEDLRDMIQKLKNSSS